MCFIQSLICNSIQLYLSTVVAVIAHMSREEEMTVDEALNPPLFTQKYSSVQVYILSVINENKKSTILGSLEGDAWDVPSTHTITTMFYPGRKM